MQNDNLNNNIVTLVGRIESRPEFSHRVFSEGFYVFNIAAARLSDNEDILPVTISDRLIDKALLEKGDYVRITGQLRSYNYYAEKHSRLMLTVFARELELLDIDSALGQNPNEIVLNGFICKAPIYRKTPFGREIADLLVAVNRAYNKSDYIPCIVWGRNARFAGGLSVGANIKLCGRIQSRIYQKKTESGSEERVAYEVSVARIELIEKSEDKGLEVDFEINSVKRADDIIEN